MQPQELPALAGAVAVLFAPALALALAVEWRVFRLRGMLTAAHAPRVVAAGLLTLLGSPVVGLVVFINLPHGTPRWLNVHFVEVAGQRWPVAPLAFVATAVVATFATWWTLHAARVRPPR